MAVTQNTYTGNGSTVLYSFTFPYLETTDIKVSLNGTVTTAYTLANATTIQFNTAPANGAAIRIYRETDDSALAATFYPGSAIRSNDLNENFTQNLYVTQESTNNAATATTTANTALTNSNTAISTANSAVSTANTASTNASAAVATANTASTNASAAVSTANTASTNATAAVNTANTASTNASNAVTTANTALSTANTASSNASAAVATANTASSNASAAVSTANTASSNATTAVNTANNALSTANAATTTANTASTNATAALNAVANSLQYVLVANVAAIPSSPANNYAIEVANSTGIESFSPLANRPAGFVGDVGLSVRMQYSTTGPTWNWLNYFPNNAETRYLKFGGGTITGNLEIGNSGSLTFEGSTANTFETTLAVTDPTADRTITLPDVSGTVVTTGDTGSVTSTMIADGTIVNADVNASAAIAGTKISPDFGSQNVTTTGTVTGASLIPSSSTVPTNGLYLPSAGSVAISTGGSGRLFVNSSGRVSIGTSSFPDQFTISNGGAGGLEIGTSTNAPILQAYNRSGAVYVDLIDSCNNRIFRTGNDSERLRITSAGLVGIGDSAPSTNLVLRGSGSSIAGVNTHFLVSDSTTAAAGVGGSILFEGNYTSGGARAAYGAIAGIKENGTDSNYAGSLRFYTRANGSLPALAMTIDSSQRVGIGSSTPSRRLQVGDYNGGNAIEIATNSTSNGGIFFADGNTGTSTYPGYIEYNHSVDAFVFATANNERFRCDSSGRLLVGTSSARSGFGNSSATPQVQIEGTSYDGSILSITRNVNSGGNPEFIFGKSRGGSVGSYTVVADGDTLGAIRFDGADGTDFATGAYISAQVDGTPGANDMPGRLVFSTTADGASSPTERMRIGSNGTATIGHASNSQVLVVNQNATSGVTTPVFQVGINQTPNNTTVKFIQANDSSVTRFEVRSDGGIANYSANNANLSDRNVKKDIAPAADTWDCIKEWEIVNYRYKDQPDDADLNLGVIAQQVAESCPEVVTVFEEAKDDQPEKLGIKEQQMYWMAIKALQEAQVRIEALEAEVAALKAQ